MNLHTHRLYLLEQHSKSFKIWSAIIRIITEGKSLIIKLGPGHCYTSFMYMAHCKSTPDGHDWN